MCWSLEESSSLVLWYAHLICDPMKLYSSLERSVSSDGVKNTLGSRKTLWEGRWDIIDVIAVICERILYGIG